VKVSILYFEGCPNHPPVREMARRIVAEHGLEAEVEEVEVSADDVRRYRFLGSPTVQVDGIDIEPGARGRKDFAMSCRVYDTPDSLPSEKMLLSALGAGAASPPTANVNQAGLLSAGGSALAAVLSSACCWIPLLAITFGATAGGGSVFLERWRPWLIGASIVLLGLGFCSVYFWRQPYSCCEAGACASRRRSIGVFNQAVLWLAVASVTASILYPSWGHLLVDDGRERASLHSASSARSMSLGIEGMTCDMCAVHVVRELRGVPGVLSAEASHEHASATLSVEGTAVPTPEQLAAAVERAGYRMTTVTTGGESP
jgi:copper chaperone CopZ